MDNTQTVGVTLLVSSAFSVLFVVEGIFVSRHMAYPISAGARGKAQVERMHARGRELQAWAKRYWPVSVVLFCLGLGMVVLG